MTELWQLYDNQGRILQGQGADKKRVFGEGLLHGAAHVWIWRDSDSGPEILLQKRAASKRTWPNRYDISAAGHIDLGEDALQAAVRETKEEIDLVVSETDLQFLGIHRAHLVAEHGAIENEYQWLYVLQLSGAINLTMQTEEVSAVAWKTTAAIRVELAAHEDQYVPHGQLYYDTIIAAIERSAHVT